MARGLSQRPNPTKGPAASRDFRRSVKEGLGSKYSFYGKIGPNIGSQENVQNIYVTKFVGNKNECFREKISVYYCFF
jgi:hypothetical protein